VHLHYLEISSDSYTPYRTPCASSIGTMPQLTSTGNFRIGQGNAIQAAGLAPNRVGVMFYAFGDRFWYSNPLPLGLGFLGAPGCSINVDIGSGTGFIVPGDAAGAATSVLLLPNDPGVVGHVLFNQYFSLDPGANASGLCATNAGRGTIGY
jgi:hypothetical protein